MKVLFSFAAVVVLALIGYGIASAGLEAIVGIVFPYIAFVIFVVGIIWRVIKWAKSPVPFRIPTSCGQQKSLSFIKHSRLENPFTGWQAFWRLMLEVLFFRSLFRNTTATLTKDKRLVFGSEKWLWAAGLAFHWSFLIIVLRHMRFFLEPVPGLVTLLGHLDGFFQVWVPVLYVTDVIIVLALTFLFLRRVLLPQVRYVSLVNDYFPLFLLLGIAVTGILMRYFFKTDVASVKELALGLVAFQPTAPKAAGPLFYSHLFLVLVLLAYFPFSKLVHMPGIFMSPTRNLANNNRAVRHINPWNPDVKVHTYEEYEAEFHDLMKEAGYPLERKENG